MVRFNAEIKKYGEQGEKTGWSYIAIPAAIASKIKPGCKKSFRVKGTLDDHSIERTSLLPVGDGEFIFPLNATLRKALGKQRGAVIRVALAEDAREVLIDRTFQVCLSDDPVALAYFRSLPRSHQNYFSKWIQSAKTAPTKEKRIARAVNALSRKMGFQGMMRLKDPDLP